MAGYDGDEEMISIAQSCRYFRSGGRMTGEGISCRSCKNSDGNRCVINAFDHVVNRMETEY